MKPSQMCRLLLLVLLAASVPAKSAVVEAETLDEMTAEADVVLKVKALKTESVQDAWLTPAQMLGASETRFKVISCLKGEFTGEEAVFRHYTDLNNSSLRYFFTAPLLRYEFTRGQNYLLWADKTEDGSLRQISKSYRGHVSQGAIRVGDDAPVQGEIKNVVWDELVKSINSTNNGTLYYTFRLLGSMSGSMRSPNGGTISLKPDFPLGKFMGLVVPLCHSTDDKIAFRAIVAAGGAGARIAKEELLAIADTHPKLPLRAMALAGLRGLKTADVEEAAHRALLSFPPEITGGNDGADVLQDYALRLLADFPGERSRFAWRAYAMHPRTRVRDAVATAIGEAKEGALAWLLGKMVDDPVQEVRYNAVRSLLTLPPALATATWKKRCTPDYYGQFFVNVLAARNPEPYLPRLIDIVNYPIRPQMGVQILDTDPDYTSGQLLFDYVSHRPKAALESAALSPVLYALENSRWAHAKASVLYRFYRTKKLENRAHVFRARSEFGSSVREDLEHVDHEFAKK